MNYLLNVLILLSISSFAQSTDSLKVESDRNLEIGDNWLVEVDYYSNDRGIGASMGSKKKVPIDNRILPPLNKIPPFQTFQLSISVIDSLRDENDSLLYKIRYIPSETIRYKLSSTIANQLEKDSVILAYDSYEYPDGRTAYVEYFTIGIDNEITPLETTVRGEEYFNHAHLKRKPRETQLSTWLPKAGFGGYIGSLPSTWIPPTTIKYSFRALEMEMEMEQLNRDSTRRILTYYYGPTSEPCRTKQIFVNDCKWWVDYHYKSNWTSRVRFHATLIENNEVRHLRKD